jgi:hypothetical protein
MSETVLSKLLMHMLNILIAISMADILERISPVFNFITGNRL